MRILINVFLLAILLSVVNCTTKKSEQKANVIVTPNKDTVKKVNLPETSLFPSKGLTQPIAEEDERDFGLAAWNQNYFQSITFSKAAKLYSAPFDTSKVLEILPIRTSIEILKFGLLNIPEPPKSQSLLDASERRYGDNIGPELTKADNILIEKYERLQNRVEPWYKVKVNSKFGYLKGKDIVRHVFKSDINDIEYLVLLDSSAYNFKSSVMVLKYDWGRKALLDSLDIGLRIDEGGEINVHQIKNPTFKGVDMMLRVTHNMDFCGGGLETAFLTDANGKLFLFPISYEGGGELGDYYESIVFLPVRDESSKVSLIANAGVENVVRVAHNDNAGLPYPKNLKVPIEQLVVIKNEEGESFKDAKGEPIIKNKAIKMRRVKSITEYFSWNGEKLVKVKE